LADTSLLLSALVFLLIALLYASVGQAGASGYIAAMALLGFAPESIKPTALLINSLVALLVAWRFTRAGHLDWQRLWPFAVLAIPMAALGGFISLPALWFERLLGSLLLFAGVLTFLGTSMGDGQVRRAPLWLALLLGALIGLLSGLTGIGGGVLIGPLLIHGRWASVKGSAAFSAVFILLNSLAALAGHWSAVERLPEHIAPLALIAMAGGLLGAQLGSRWLPERRVQQVLGLLLLVAGSKLCLG
jgi:uncharacterized protein